MPLVLGLCEVYKAQEFQGVVSDLLRHDHDVRSIYRASDNAQMCVLYAL